MMTSDDPAQLGGVGIDDAAGVGLAEAPMRVRPSIRTKPARSETETDQPKQWHVVLMDDDEHSYEYVIVMVQTLFAKSLEEAFQIAERVDRAGRAVCMTTHRELAELKQEQIHSFGGDPLIASCQGAMSAVLEPADFAGDDEDDDDKGRDGSGGHTPRESS